MACEILGHVVEITGRVVACNKKCEECPFVENDFFFPKTEPERFSGEEVSLNISEEEILKRFFEEKAQKFQSTDDYFK